MESCSFLHFYKKKHFEGINERIHCQEETQTTLLKLHPTIHDMHEFCWFLWIASNIGNMYHDAKFQKFRILF
jgi:hypothetical protein